MALGICTLKSVFPPGLPLRLGFTHTKLGGMPVPMIVVKYNLLYATTISGRQGGTLEFFLALATAAWQGARAKGKFVGRFTVMGGVAVGPPPGGTGKSLRRTRQLPGCRARLAGQVATWSLGYSWSPLHFPVLMRSSGKRGGVPARKTRTDLHLVRGILATP